VRTSTCRRARTRLSFPAGRNRSPRFGKFLSTREQRNFLSKSIAGSIPLNSAGGQAIITSTRRDARIIRSRRKGCTPADMIRQVIGEDLKVGANLTWGPCFDYQKQFFTGKDDPVSRPPYLLRYDVEVSGFGSHQSGHLCLLRLREQMYPGGDSMAHWPNFVSQHVTLGSQPGGALRPAHSGWGSRCPGRYFAKLRHPALRWNWRKRIHCLTSHTMFRDRAVRSCRRLISCRWWILRTFGS
jgi:hypothetical protein